MMGNEKVKSEGDERQPVAEIFIIDQKSVPESRIANRSCPDKLDKQAGDALPLLGSAHNETTGTRFLFPTVQPSCSLN